MDSSVTLKQRNVVMIYGVTYNQIDDQGLHITLKGVKRF